MQIIKLLVRYSLPCTKTPTAADFHFCDLAGTFEFLLWEVHLLLASSFLIIAIPRRNYKIESRTLRTLYKKNCKAENHVSDFLNTGAQYRNTSYPYSNHTSSKHVLAITF